MGEKLTSCRYGRPVAELVPVQRGSRTGSDPQLSQVTVNGELTGPTEAEGEDA